jgi:hypothetical protein
MKSRHYFLMDETSPDGPRAAWEPCPGPRAGAGPDRGERASAYALDLLGSWPGLAAILILVIAGVAMAHSRDPRASGVATVILLVSGLTLASMSLVLMTARRLDRIAGEQACRHRGSARRSQAVSEEILAQIEQINSGLARLTARIEVLQIAVINFRVCGCSSLRTIRA